MVVKVADAADGDSRTSRWSTRSTVTNNGPSDAADVVVVDDLPAGVSFVSADVVVGTGVCLGAPSGAVTCQLGTVGGRRDGADQHRGVRRPGVRLRDRPGEQR